MTDTNDLPRDIERLSPWFSIIREANSVIVRGALQYVTITALIDRQGRPILWGGIQRIDMHPRYRNVETRDEQ